MTITLVFFWKCFFNLLIMFFLTYLFKNCINLIPYSNNANNYNTWLFYHDKSLLKVVDCSVIRVLVAELGHGIYDHPFVSFMNMVI